MGNAAVAGAKISYDRICVRCKSRSVMLDAFDRRRGVLSLICLACGDEREEQTEEGREQEQERRRVLEDEISHTERRKRGRPPKEWKARQYAPAPLVSTAPSAAPRYVSVLRPPRLRRKPAWLPPPVGTKFTP